MAGSHKQYLPSKPQKRGYKVYCRNGISGIVYDFLLYGGKVHFLIINFLI